MIQSIKNLSDFLKIEDQQQDFDKDISFIIDIIKKESGLILNKKEIFVKSNIIKIKTISNVRFLILLNLEKVNDKIKALNKGFILEL